MVTERIVLLHILICHLIIREASEITLRRPYCMNQKLRYTVIRWEGLMCVHCSHVCAGIYRVSASLYLSNHNKGLARPIESKGKRNIYPSCVMCWRLLLGFSFIIQLFPLFPFWDHKVRLWSYKCLEIIQVTVCTARKESQFCLTPECVLCHLEKVSVQKVRICCLVMGKSIWVPLHGIPLTSISFSQASWKRKNCLAIVPDAWSLAREPGGLWLSTITGQPSRESLNPGFPGANQWKEGALFCTIILATVCERKSHCLCSLVQMNGWVIERGTRLLLYLYSGAPQSRNVGPVK